MLLHCHGAKGGVGTTVVCAIAALGARRPALLVDLAGDVPEVLGGIDLDGRPGVLEWLRSGADATELDELVVDIGRHHDLAILPSRVAAHHRADEIDAMRWSALADWLVHWSASRDGIVVVDAGAAPRPTALSDACDQRLLVTRACYLALRAARRGGVEPTGVVLVAEPGRALGAHDVARAAGAPTVATVSWDPSVARAVDAGLLCAPPPRSISRVVERSIDRLVPPAAA